MRVTLWRGGRHTILPGKVTVACPAWESADMDQVGAVRRTPTSSGMGTGMAMWVVLPLCWLLGISFQLSEPALSPVSTYQTLLWLALGGVALLLTMRHWLARQAVAPPRWLWCPVIFMLAWSSTGWRAHSLASQHWPSDWQDVDVRVQVVGLPQPMSGGAWRFDARLLHAPSPPSGLRLPQLIRLYADAKTGMSGVRAGQLWALRVSLHEPDGLSNPGGFDATRSLFEQGIRAVGNVRHKAVMPDKLSEPGFWSTGLIDRFRQAVRESIEDRVGQGRAAGVLVGLSVGDQSAIDRADWDIFRRTGVAHAVSISGTHIAMLGWLVGWAVRRLWPLWHAGVHAWPAPTAARVFAVLASAVYAVVAGWGVPAQRTVLMMATMAMLHIGGRRWPWPLVWLLAAACITILDPWALWQPGFWLSFVAVGILMSSGLAESVLPGHERTTWRAQVKAAAADMIHTQWRVSLALAPLSLVCFQEVSLVGVVANLFAIPVFTLGITPVALLGVVCAPLWDLGAVLVQLTATVLGYMADWPWAVWHSPTLPVWSQVLAVAAGALWVQPMSWSWRLLLWPCLLPVWCLPQGWQLIPPPPEGHFTLLAVDIGQGTAVLLKTARHTLLFDTGGRLPSGVDMGQRVLVPLLHSLGVRQLDALVISHADTDHVGGARSILEALPVHELRSTLDDTHELRQWRLPRRAVGVPHVPCAAGQRWQWDGVQFEILHPGDQDLGRRGPVKDNALSCVLRAWTKDGGSPAEPSVLITGDIEAEQERELLTRHTAAPSSSDPGGTLRSTILIAPHHGSKTSSTLPFLQAVQPEQTVVQAGRRNRYGHPAPAVLARYASLGLPVISTPECGAFLWHSKEQRQTAPNVRQHGGSSSLQPALGQCWRALQPRYWDLTATPPAH